MNLYIKKILILLHLLLISIIFESCTRNDFESDFKSFPTEINLTGDKPIVDYPGFFYFWDIEIIDSIIIGYNFTDHSSPLLNFFNKNDFSYIKNAIMVGKGPSEITIPGKLWVNEEKRIIYIQDAGKLSNCEIILDSILFHEKYFPEKFINQNKKYETFLATQRFSLDDNFIQAGINGENLLTITDNQGNELNKIGSHFLKMEDRDSMAYNKLMDHNFTIHPNKKYYAISYNFFDRITCIDEQGQQVFSIVGPDKISPEYSEKLDSYKFNPVWTKRAYYGISSDEKYIYAKYLNKPLYDQGSNVMNKSSIIHVFSWEGDPVAQINLDREIDYNFIIDNKRLIGLDSESENPWIVYDLKHTDLYN